MYLCSAIEQSYCQWLSLRGLIIKNFCLTFIATVSVTLFYCWIFQLSASKYWIAQNASNFHENKEQKPMEHVRTIPNQVISIIFPSFYIRSLGYESVWRVWNYFISLHRSVLMKRFVFIFLAYSKKNKY